MDLYQAITDRIIKELESGTVPWRKPWKGSSGAISRATGKPYSILNQLLLPKEGEYVTYKQAAEEGHPVRKGEKASAVYFFKFLEKEDEETGKIKSIPLLRYYSVFHVSQCEGMKPRFALSEEPNSNLQPDQKAENIISNYVQRSGVRLNRTHGDKAYYQPSTDTIVVPEISQFSDIAEFYSTLFHESVHSTGHPSRLNRINNVARFGSVSYSKEELIAELGASYLVNSAGLESVSSFQNSAAYVNSWLNTLKGDKYLLVSAAAQAEKAVNLILIKE